MSGSLIEIGGQCLAMSPKDSWKVGKVSDWNGKLGSVKCDDGEGLTKLNDESIVLVSDEVLAEDVDDLLNLSLLHDGTLLHVLRKRYMRDVIYTNIGAIVVALNPFNFKIAWYTDDNMPKYLCEGDRIENNLPHSWAVAHNTYFELRNDSENQTILVSGESGAGKTEASKIVMKYLAAISCKSGDQANKDAASQVGVKINMASPPLESFGNAKTVRNDNSSRFGKFMRVKIDPSGYLVGAHITKYLLEKSRIVTASIGERVYHSFYLVVRGQDPEYKLGADKDYKSLAAGKTFDNKEFDSKEEFEEVCKALSTMGVAEEDIHSIWHCVAGVLNALNIEFVENGEGSLLSDKTTNYVDRMCEHWQIEKDTFLKEATTTTLSMGGQMITKELNPVKAIDGRDALVKATYDLEFGWLVETCNDILDKPGDMKWIGLLDIFGFEDFEINSFEQICINLANEALQGHYNEYIFQKDMDLCRAEGIDVNEIEFPDNAPCISMMAAKGGVLHLLDEECMLGKGSDDGWLQKVEEHHKKNPFFMKKQLAKDSFIVRHYAGDVSYTVTGILDKNRDTLKEAYKNMMRSSKSPFIAALHPDPATTSTKKQTVGGFFKEQVGLLMSVISSTNPHWIRCIKPHPAKKPLMFDGIQTMKQLASSGVLGTVKIRKAGYPIRLSYPNFKVRYRVIAADPTIDPKAIAEGVFQALGFGNMDGQLGKSICFLKPAGYVALEKKKKEQLKVFAARMAMAGRTRAARLRIACQRRVAYVETIQSFLRSKPSEREWRARQYDLMKDAIIEATKNLLNGMRDETSVRAEIEAEEAAAHKELVSGLMEGLESVIEQWWKDKPERDAKVQKKLLEEEGLLREEVHAEEDGVWRELMKQMAVESKEAEKRASERDQQERLGREALEAEEDTEWSDLIKLMAAEGKEAEERALERDEQERKGRESVENEEDTEWEQLMQLLEVECRQAEDRQFEREDRERKEEEAKIRAENERLRKIEEARREEERQIALREMEKKRRIALAAWKQQQEVQNEELRRLDAIKKKKEVFKRDRLQPQLAAQELKQNERLQIARARLAYPSETAFDLSPKLTRGHNIRQLTKAPPNSTHTTPIANLSKSPSHSPSPSRGSPTTTPRRSANATPTSSCSPSFPQSPAPNASTVSVASMTPEFPASHFTGRKDRLNQARLDSQGYSSLDMITRLKRLRDCKSGNFMISPKIDLTDPRNPENPSNPHWKPPENDMVKLPNGRSVPMNKLEAEHGEQANGANGRRNRRVSINGIVNGHTRNR